MSDRPRVFVAVQRDEYAVLFAPESTKSLAAIADVDHGTGSERIAIPDDVADRYDVLVTSWSTAPFAREALNGGRLRLALHCAGSVRHLFPPESLRGRLRLSQPGAEAMAPAVAEMALTLTLVLLRNVHEHDRALRQTRDWSAGGAGRLGRSLSAQSVGIVGLSRVGIHYARMMRALGVTRLSAYDPYATPDRARALCVNLVDDLDRLVATSDVLALHAPSTPQTRKMIGARQLADLPDGAVLVNTARSWLVDEAALTAELATGRISAGLDVFDTEPLPSGSPFYSLDNVVVLPHVAGGTVDARLRQGIAVVNEIKRFLDDDTLHHEVTIGNYDRLA